MAFSQNNPCQNPKNINSLPYSYSGSTCGNNPISPVCGQGFSASGEAFKITIPAGVSCIDIRLSNLTGNLGIFYLRVLDDCPTTNPNANCIWKDSYAFDGKSFLSPTEYITQNVELTPGQTYYITISSSPLNTGTQENPSTTVCGDFKIEVINDTDCAKYTDLCAMEDISTLPFTSNANTCDGRPLTSIRGGTCLLNLNGTEYVYHYRNDTEDVCAEITINSPHPDVVLSIRDFCGNNDPQTNNCLGDYTMDNNIPQGITLKKGKDYYFYVSNEVYTQYCAPFEFNITKQPSTEVSCDKAITFQTPFDFDYNDFKCRNLADINNSFFCQNEEYYNIYEITVTEPSCLSLTYQSENEAGKFLTVNAYDGCPESASSNCVVQSAPRILNRSSLTIRGFINKYSLPTAGTYYIVVSSQFEGAEYYIRSDVTSADFDYGTCASPITSPNAEFNQDIFIDPCHQLNFAQTHESQCGFEEKHEGQTKIVQFTAPEDNCYLFQLKGASNLLGSTIFDKCPSLNDATCLNSAVGNDKNDSLSLSMPLSKGQTVFWAVSVYERLLDTEVLNAQIKPLSDDPCYDCEELICRNCAYISTETSEITGWKSYIGDFNNPAQQEVLVSKAINNRDDSRHTVTSAGSYDTYVPTMPVNNPFLGRYSIKLGNRMSNAEGEQMTFTYKIDKNSTFFTYYYAVVFEDPGHNPDQQPYFRVRVLTENGTEIQCGVYEVSAGAGIPGFKKSNIAPKPLYKEWSAVSIPVVDYIGQELTVEFITRDCSEGAHFGYAYFDATCENLGNLDDEIIICGEDSVALVAPPGFAIYNWSNGKSGQIIYTDTPGSFSVDMETLTGCKYQQTAMVTKIDDPILGGVDFSQPCGADYLNIKISDPLFKAEPNDSLFWIFNHTDTIPDSIDWQYRGAYGGYHISLNYKIPGKCNFVIEDTINFVPPLNNTPTIADSFYCQNDSVRISTAFEKFMEYKWSNGDSINFTYFKTVGDKYVIRTLGECRDSIPFKLTEQTTVPLNLGADKQICWYDSLQIGVPQQPNTTYAWNTGETTTSIFAKDSIQYTITSNINGCLIKDSITISKFRQAFVDLPKDTAICQGDSIKIGFSDAKPHIWSTGETTDSISIKTNGLYFLTLDDGNCIEKDSIQLTILIPPQFNLGPDVIDICETDSIILGPNNLNPNQHTFLWNTGQNTSQIKVKDAGKYIQTIFDGKCQSTDSVIITESITPIFNLTTDTIFCQDSSVTLDIGPVVGSIIWNTQETTSSIIATSVGKYKVTVTNGTCVVSDSVNVTQQIKPSLFLGNDTLLCSTEQLNVVPQYQNTINPKFIWTDGETNTNRTLKSPSNTYTLQMYDSVCFVQESIKVDFLPPPTPSFPDQIEVCIGDSILLNPSTSNLYDYLWSTGETTQTITVKDSGIYNVQVSLNSCNAFASVKITNRTPPDIDLGPDTSMCYGETYVAGDTVLGATEYLWSTDFDENILPIKLNGTYILYATAGSCTVSDTLEITLNDLPEINVSSYEPVICPNDSSFFSLECLNCVFDNFGSQNQYSQWFHPLDSITLMASTIFMCKNVYSFNTLVDEDCLEQIFVPNAFTPNSDSKNELFYPVSADPNNYFTKIEIRDRWGELIYSTTNQPFAWDGTYKGKIVQQGVYQWQVWYTDIYLKNHYIIGHVNVLR